MPMKDLILQLPIQLKQIEICFKDRPCLNQLDQQETEKTGKI